MVVITGVLLTLGVGEPIVATVEIVPSTVVESGKIITVSVGKMLTEGSEVGRSVSETDIERNVMKVLRERAGSELGIGVSGDELLTVTVGCRVVIERDGGPSDNVVNGSKVEVSGKSISLEDG